MQTPPPKKTKTKNKKKTNITPRAQPILQQEPTYITLLCVPCIPCQCWHNPLVEFMHVPLYNIVACPLPPPPHKRGIIVYVNCSLIVHKWICLNQIILGCLEVPKSKRLQSDIDRWQLFSSRVYLLLRASSWMATEMAERAIRSTSAAELGTWHLRKGPDNMNIRLNVGWGSLHHRGRKEVPLRGGAVKEGVLQLSCPPWLGFEFEVVLLPCSGITVF